MTILIKWHMLSIFRTTRNWQILAFLEPLKKTNRTTRNLQILALLEPLKKQSFFIQAWKKYLSAGRRNILVISRLIHPYMVSELWGTVKPLTKTLMITHASYIVSKTIRRELAWRRLASDNLLSQFRYKLNKNSDDILYAGRLINRAAQWQ